MARPKYTKKDINHATLVQECRDLGMVVWDTADIGGEVLDLIVLWMGKAIPVEVKAPGKDGDLTLGEQGGIDKLREVGVEPVIATCVEDIKEAFGVTR